MSKLLTIAEVGQAHDGSLGILHSYIDALADVGVNAIKFQTHIADAESSPYEPFRIKFSYQDQTRYDYWKRMEFTFDQWKGIKEHCDQRQIEFISSPFSNAAVNLLEKLGVKRYKIGSGEVSNLLLLKKVAQTGKDIILSSGMSSLKELDKTISFLRTFGNNISVLQCTTAYPTRPEQWGLNIIQELKSKYRLPVGFSDHSGDIYAGLAAVALGAEILEFHVVFNKQMFGPDTAASLDLSQIRTLIKGTNQIVRCTFNPVDKSEVLELTDLKQIFEKSLAINKSLKQGDILSEDDLESKKPAGMGIPAGEFERVIGKKLSRDMEKWDFLNLNDLIND